MQTFVPYPDLRVSCQVLDDRRLGKQRVETFQILRALTWPAYAWKNHPAVRMWRGFIPGLVLYGVENCREWTRRGYADSVLPQLLAWSGGEVPDDPPMPPWWGLEALHLSHRSALLRKDPEFYRPLFGDDEPDDLPYLWPPDVFPRWPVRRGEQPLPLHDGLRLLGFSEPRPGQAEAVEAVAAGRDALLVAKPGTGGSATGLLAGLVVPGRTLWVTPYLGPTTAEVPAVPLQPHREVPLGDPVPAIARPPGPEDLAAMQAETSPPEYVFVHPDRLTAPDGLSLLVLDRAASLGPEECAAVRALRAEHPDVPALALVGRADADERARLADALGLRDPVHAGGGWDPAGSWLGVAPAPTVQAGRKAVAEAVRRHGAALVVVPSRERADRVVTGLAASGLRAAVWAPPPMRASRAVEAVGAWRSKRLDALVVPEGELPPLGRARLKLLVGEHVAPERWRDLVAELSPVAAVQVSDDAPAGCRRRALLEPYGEPVEVPCGRCDVCAPDGPVSAPAGPPAAAPPATPSPGG